MSAYIRAGVAVQARRLKKSHGSESISSNEFCKSSLGPSRQSRIHAVCDLYTLAPQGGQQSNAFLLECIQYDTK